MKQTLIEKYIDGTTTRAEEQQLLQLLQTVPEGERTKQEEALLLMLTPRPKVYDDELFNVNPNHNVNLSTKRCLRYASLALVAVAASIIVAVLFLWHQETTPPAHPKQEKVVVQQIPTEKEQKPQIVVSGNLSDLPRPLPRRGGVSSPLGGDKREVLEEDNDPHYAWARPLIDNYHEDEAFSRSIAMGDKEPPFKEGIEIPTLEDLGTEWASNDIHKDIATIKAKGERLQRKIEELTLRQAQVKKN